eukprot:4282049-Amphidinium_carterae.1
MTTNSHSSEVRRCWWAQTAQWGLQRSKPKKNLTTVRVKSWDQIGRKVAAKRDDPREGFCAIRQASSQKFGADKGGSEPPMKLKRVLPELQVVQIVYHILEAHALV